MGSANFRYGLVVRGFDLDKDYDIVRQWWINHGSYPPKPEHLSSTGIIIEADKPVCAGWLYQTDSKICVFEFVISDPLAGKEIRDAALMLLIETIKQIASEKYSLIYTSVRGQKYISRLINSGFVEVDKDQTHCFCEV